MRITRSTTLWISRHPNSNSNIETPGPINNLPPETLTNIFSFCLPPHYHVSPTGPLVLSWICHLWREVLLRTPHLWCTVWVKYSIEKFPTKAGLRSLREWVQRSKELPLDVILQDISTSAREFYILRLLGILLPTTHRWRSLQLRIRWNLEVAFNAIKSRPLPLLESLGVTPNGIRPFFHDIDIHTDEASLPSLMHLNSKWTGILVEIPNGVSNVNLRTLQLATRLSAYSVLSYIGSTPNLEIIRIEFNFCSHPEEVQWQSIIRCPPSPNMRRITLSRLHTFSLEGPLAKTSPFLHGLRCPSLSTFRIDINAPGVDDSEDAQIVIPPWLQINAFLEVSQAPLTEFEPLGSIDKGDLLACLQKNLQLEILRGSHSLLDLIVEGLLRLEESDNSVEYGIEGVCPHLQRIDLICLPPKECLDPVADLIHSRTGSNAGALQALHVHTSGGIYLRTEWHLRRFIETLRQDPRL